jgi:signal transduction histidine kinase
LLSCLSNEVPSLLVSAFSFAEDRSARLILVGPSVRGSYKSALRFLQRFMDQVGPALPNICFVRDIRKEAEDNVRARLVRELHDGTIQSLLSAEMQIEVLRRQNRTPLSETDLRLTSVQNLIHQEAVNLRDMIEGTKPLNFTPDELPNYLADLIIKFRRETGISVRLEFGDDNVALPPGVCYEIVRIVQEGLSNARKHSGARNIVVGLSRDSEGHKLLIADDGQGFGFRGRVTQSQLDATHRGPLVIKERVRLIGGELTIDSSPGHGARLEITIPDGSHD